MSKEKYYTIQEFRTDFPDDNACLHHLFKLSGVYKSKVCPKCGCSSEFKRIPTRRSYHCVSCYHQFYPTKGTIFEKSTTPLTYWFYAIYLFTASKNGLSAAELERQLGVNYKTAWRMLMKIRELVGSESFTLSGVVECDETFIGGKNKNRHYDKKIQGSQGRSFKDKTPVMGMLERGGNVVAKVVKDTRAHSLMPHAFNTIEKGSTVYTDEWDAYSSLSADYNHEFVFHSRGQYANGDCTTNRIENFWSVVKRTLNGSYIRVTKPYLQRYIDEVTFRYNNKDNKDIFRTLIFSLAS